MKGKKAGAPAPKRQTPPAANVKAVRPVQPKPRQARLPGVDDPVIEELQRAAEDYADVRDERMELTKREVQKQEMLLQIMKKYGKSTYVHEGVECKLIHEKEKVRVKIRKGEDEK